LLANRGKVVEFFQACNMKPTLISNGYFRRLRAQMLFISISNENKKHLTKNLRKRPLLINVGWKCQKKYFIVSQSPFGVFSLTRLRFFKLKDPQSFPQKNTDELFLTWWNDGVIYDEASEIILCIHKLKFSERWLSNVKKNLLCWTFLLSAQKKHCVNQRLSFWSFAYPYMMTMNWDAPWYR